MIIKVPCIYLYVTVFGIGCVNVLMQRCLWLQQDLLPSTLLVCAFLLQPGAEHFLYHSEHSCLDDQRQTSLTVWLHR